MKKNYLFLAAATTLFAACVQTDVVNDIPEPQQQAISFDAFANKTTRAEIEDDDDLQSVNGGFHVWGYKYRGDEAEYTVFNNEPISWDATNSTWSYTNTQYWDQTATYKFYAVAPKAPQGVNYAIGDGNVAQWNKYMIKITGATSGKSTDVTDYLIDRDGKSSKIDNNQKTLTGKAGFDNGVVSFNFNHIMAKLSFKFKAGVDENITITSLKMTGWNNGTGTFTQSETTVPSTVTNGEWDFETNVNADDDDCIIIDNSNKVSGVNKDNAKACNRSFIMVPQTITHSDANATNATPEKGLTFTISYTIIHGYVDGSAEANAANNDPKDEVFLNQVGILPTTQVWGTDTHTTYTIIVSPTKIEFGDPTIEDWSVEDRDAVDDDDEDNTDREDDNLPL